MTTEGPAVRLALSLHAPNDKPAGKSCLSTTATRWRMVAACREWRHTHKRKVFIEYHARRGATRSSSPTNPS